MKFSWLKLRGFYCRGYFSRGRRENHSQRAGQACGLDYARPEFKTPKDIKGKNRDSRFGALSETGVAIFLSASVSSAARTVAIIQLAARPRLSRRWKEGPSKQGLPISPTRVGPDGRIGESFLI